MRYSRLAQTEEKKNKRKAVIYIIFAMLVLLLLVTLGIPLIVKMTGIVSDIRQSDQPIEQEDTTPPAPPRLDPLPEATNSQRLEIKGSSEPGSTAILFLNNERVETLVNDKGEFTYTHTLRNGNNTISVQSKDAQGNESALTDDYEVVYDNEPPEVEIGSPSDGERFFGLKERQITIEGKTEPNAQVTINDKFVAVDADGTFAFATTLTEGDNEFKIKVSDNAGNITETSFKVSYSE
jgi:hypothetical protein